MRVRATCARGGPGTMGSGKIRHIAIRCEDTEKTAQWLQDALELPLGLGAGEHTRRPGFEHIGVTVADDAVARERLLAAGATELNPVGLGDVYYEAKFQSPEGLVVDVGHWAGTSPIPQEAPAEPERAYAGE